MDIICSSTVIMAKNIPLKLCKLLYCIPLAPLFEHGLARPDYYCVEFGDSISFGGTCSKDSHKM